MQNEHSWYYLERARTSLTMAQRARDPDIAAIHLDLYNRYLEKAGQPESDRQMLRVVVPRD